MDLELKGRRAIVTGATRGIGQRIARSLASEGMDLAICSRNADEVARTQDALASLGVNVVGEAVDVRDGEAYKAWLSRAADALGGCDAFVPVVSAGGGAADENWFANLEIDLLGAVRGIDVLLPHLEARNGAAVFISTTAAIEHFPIVQAYNALKAGLITYAKQKSQETFTKGVRINVVSPGSIYFEGGSWERAEKGAPEFFNMIRDSIPAKRLGKPEEVADAVTFLLSARASWINGSNLVVDGGQTKRVDF